MQSGEESVWCADFAFPLGVNNCYVTEIDTLADWVYFYPFTEWDSFSFMNWNEDVDTLEIYHGTEGVCTWDSYSCQGQARLSPGSDAPWFHSDPAGLPVLAFQFKIHTVNRPELIDSTICNAIGAGYDPTQHFTNAGDTLGNVGFDPIETFACFYFSPNQPPDIIPIGDYPACTYEDLEILFDVYDADGDPVTVTSNADVPELIGSTPAGDAITWHYTMGTAGLCGQCFSGDITVTANDGSNDPVTETLFAIEFIGLMTASMDDSLYIWPGMEEWMPIYLDVCADCFCLGGFVFTIEYDASVFTATDDSLGAALAGGEYWNVNYGVAGLGTVRVTFINDLNNQVPAREICGLQSFMKPIFYIKFLLDPGFPYNDFTDFCSPVCFMYDLDGEDHYEYNNVSDETGYYLWINDGCIDDPDSVEYATWELDFECGNLKVVGKCSVYLGDINWNGLPYEIGDAILLANHLSDPIGYPFNLRQMFASDVNMDDIQASIGDLIFLLNIINGYQTPLVKMAPLDMAAIISMPSEAYGDMDVRITSEAAIGGALVEINHTGVELGVPAAEGMDIQYSDNGDVMTVLVYNAESNAFAPGANVLFTVPVMSEGAVSLGNVSVSDGRGALLDARGEIVAPIPTEFSVSQNFPNPFNAKTRISFGLPTDADVTVNIYNVAGQMVEAFDLGHVQAGTHSIVWDASDVASGVYFYKVAAGNNTETMKMTLLK
jgi:hypothetical protein